MDQSADEQGKAITEEFVAFISHSSKDAEKAQQVAQSLEKKGLRCWIAPRNLRPGKEYSEEIIYGLRDSRCLVLLLSEAANKSIHVRNEVERAVSYGKPVFPIRIEEVLPSPALELSVSSVHWISAWSGNLLDHVEDLASVLQNPDGIRVGSPLPPASPLTRFKRFVSANLLSLCIIGLLLGGGYVAYSFVTGTMQDGMTQEALPLEQFSESDITMQGHARSTGLLGEVGSYQYNLMFGPTNMKGIRTLKNVRYQLTLDDGQEYANTATAGVAGFTFESMQLVQSVTLVISDENNQSVGPIRFSLADINRNLEQQAKAKTDITRQKQLAQWKQKVENRQLFEQCSRLPVDGFSFCKLASHTISGNLQDMVKHITIEVADSGATYLIDPKETSSKGLGVHLDNKNQPYYIFPFPLEALKYQVTFTDGEQSSLISQDRNPRFDQDIRRKMFKFVQEDPQAPDLYAVLEIGSTHWQPTANLSRIVLTPLVGNEVVSIAWRTSLQGEEMFDEQEFTQIISWRSTSHTKVFGDIGSNSELQVRYRFSSGDVKTFTYTPDWHNWGLE